MEISAMLACDGYKTSHKRQYNPKTQLVYSTWTPRKSRIEGIDEVVFFGLQYFIKEWLIDGFNQTFFWMEKQDVINEFKRIMSHYTGDTDTSHWEALYDLGYLPIRIDAVEEGTLIPIRCPMFTIQNTLPEFYWLTNFIETIMSTEIWKPMTSATIALEYRKILDMWAEKTCDDNSHVDYQAHDFSLRGMAGLDCGMSSGAGHLLSFKGTDTIPAILWLEKYYNANCENEIVGRSVCASEHSVQEANILYNNYTDRVEGEYENLKDFLTRIYPSETFSYVADTYNLWECIKNVLPRLKEEILNRDGKLILRPDCYDDKTQILTADGWKYFKDLKKGVDKVAQYHEDGSIDFVIPIKYYSEHYEGDMYKFSNFKHNLDLFVTPNHRMVYRNRKTGRLGIKFAEDIKYFNGHNSIHAGKKTGNIDKLTPKERLLIAVQADGRFRCSENSSKFIIDFNFAKKRKIDKLISICEEGGFKYKLIENSRMFNDSNKKWNNQSTIYVYLNERPSKMFSEWVSLEDKSYLWCQDFIHEVVQWDGSIRSSHRYKYDSTEQSNAEIVQMIALLAGYRTKYSVYHDARSEKFRDTHTVNILINRDYLDGQAIIKEVKKYSGYVYCIQVPTGMLVVRRNGQVSISGNSGNPCDIICGTGNIIDNLDSPYRDEIKKGVVELIWDIFGGTINSKGYKVLNPHIGAIYGDAITLERADEICRRLEAKGFASSNITFGVGSYTYNMNTRDTFGFALKTTYGVVDGKELMLYKDPITDSGEKKSQKGMVCVVYDKDRISHIDELALADKQLCETVDLLKPVFLNGKLLRETSLSEIRERLVK